MHIGNNALQVHWKDIELGALALTLLKRFILNLLIKPLDFFAINSSATEDHFEAIIVRWIMAASNHNSRFWVLSVNSLISCKIDHWGSHHAEINDIDTGGQKTPRKSL